MQAKAPGLSYRLLSLLLLPVWLIHAFVHGWRQNNPIYFKQRIRATGSTKKGLIWVHASSVGEVAAVSPLVDLILKNQHQVLFTSFTASGYQAIQRQFGQQVETTVLPIDFWLSCNRFLKRYSIKLCLITETELWPEMLYQVKKQQIPLIQINARLSKKSLQARPWVFQVLQRSLSYFDVHLCRNEQDRNNLIQLGANSSKVKVAGNLKYAQCKINESFEPLIHRPYILLASSHEGEEKQFAEMLPKLSAGYLAVIAPRHPNRCSTILLELKPLALNIAVRSKKNAITKQTQIYLADTLGELKALMQHAELIVMGGSFDDTGGHNLLEPAALGKAIITGPADSNIKQDIEWLSQYEAVIQVNKMTICMETVNKLLRDKKRKIKLGENAKAAVASQDKVLERYWQEIEQYLI